MSTIYGYGEDAFTFWALKYHPYYILKEFRIINIDYSKEILDNFIILDTSG